LPGVVGSEPGASRFHLFSHFHHFTAESQRLQKKHFIIFIIFGQITSTKIGREQKSTGYTEFWIQVFIQHCRMDIVCYDFDISYQILWYLFCMVAC
jgi:hypothetical protein